MTVICAACGERTKGGPCASCGEDPLLDGRYLLQEELGRGASGTTFRALEVATGERVAVKEMPLGRAPSEKARQLVAREAAVLRQLDHPGIPRFHDSRVVGTGRTQAVMLVQELIDGQDLSAELASRRFTPREVLAIAAELLQILEYLHDLSPPVIHRDLKPGNVRRRSRGGLVLLDFGAVRDSLRDLDGSGSTVAGTFGYMAPEQLVGDATPMSDLYALGALMVQLLSRVEPQQMLSVGGGLEWEGRVSVPAGVRDLLRDLLTVDPGARRERLRGTAEVRERVERLLAAPDRPGPSDGRTGPAVTVERVLGQWSLTLPPTRALLGAAVAIVSLIGLGLATMGSGDPEPEPPVPAAAAIPAAPPPPPPPVEPQTSDGAPPGERVEVWRGGLPPLGDPSAPVELVVFSDYQCPFCRRHADTLRQLMEERPGKVAVYWRDRPMPFHHHARPAAHAARCAADQGRWEPMHRALIEGGSNLSESAPREAAKRLGLDLSTFDRCMQDQRHEAAIARDEADAAALDAEGVPTTFVAGERIVGARPLNDFVDAVDRALAER